MHSLFIVKPYSQTPQPNPHQFNDPINPKGTNTNTKITWHYWLQCCIKALL